MKESIIRISKPASKVPPESNDSELLSFVTQSEEFNTPEEPEEPEPEPTDMLPEPTYARFAASTNSSGWKASDILREVRLDNFYIDGAD